MTRPERSLARWESAVEKQIREAMGRGELDNLPAAGQPLPGLGGPYDDEWWIKAKLRREQLSYLPPAIALRREVEVAREQVATAPSEAAVRKIVADLNSRIVEVNSTTVTGPTSTIMPTAGPDVPSMPGISRRRPARTTAGSPPSDARSSVASACAPSHRTMSSACSTNSPIPNVETAGRSATRR